MIAPERRPLVDSLAALPPLAFVCVCELLAIVPLDAPWLPREIRAPLDELHGLAREFLEVTNRSDDEK